MKHLLFIILTALSISFTPCMVSKTHARIELSEIETTPIKIELVQGSTLYITGAVGKTVYIYNLVGIKLMSIKIDSQEKKIDLGNFNNRVLIIKIGNISKRINLLSR